ncbi:MAG: hypothetical protein ACTSR8_21135 [Promethearchaeota archaeon]
MSDLDELTPDFGKMELFFFCSVFIGRKRRHFRESRTRCNNLNELEYEIESLQQQKTNWLNE